MRKILFERVSFHQMWRKFKFHIKSQLPQILFSIMKNVVFNRQEFVSELQIMSLTASCER